MKGFSFTMRLHMLSGHGAASTCCLRDHLRRKTEFVTPVHSSIHRQAFVTATLCVLAINSHVLAAETTQAPRPHSLIHRQAAEVTPPEAGISQTTPGTTSAPATRSPQRKLTKRPSQLPAAVSSATVMSQATTSSPQAVSSGSDKQDWNREPDFDAGHGRCRTRSVHVDPSVNDKRRINQRHGLCHPRTFVSQNAGGDCGPRHRPRNNRIAASGRRTRHPEPQYPDARPDAIGGTDGLCLFSTAFSRTIVGTSTATAFVLPSPPPHRLHRAPEAPPSAGR